MRVHDSFHLTVRFEDGSLALIELAYALPQSGKMVRRIVVSGTSGTLAHDTGDDPGLMTDTTNAPPSSIEDAMRSEEHTSELQSLMRISYAVFCLKKKTNT